MARVAEGQRLIKEHEKGEASSVMTVRRGLRFMKQNFFRVLVLPGVE